jgi:tetratricopeptide (TPR) repeat protein
MFLSSARQIHEALRLLERAIARDPRYAPVLAGAALCCFRLHLDGRSENPATYARTGADYAHRALEVAGDNPAILVQVAIVRSYFGEDIGAMLALVDRALALDPNSAGSWHISGLLRSWAGLPDIAIKHIETAVRLNPRIPVGRSMIQLVLAHFLARRFDAALPLLVLAVQEDPSHPMPQRVLAACYAHMGRLDEAREAVTRLREITPVVISDARFLRNPEHRELFLSGLRLAADEETLT